MNGTIRTKVWKATALAATLLMLPLFSAPAQAGGFSLGALFRIGGIHFNLVLGDFGYGHPRGYYSRTADEFSYGSTRCNSYCLNHDNYHYHHESCPLVRRHLAHFDIDPLRLFDRYAPGYGERYDRGYRHDSRYDGYGDDRYDDRYDDGYRRDRGSRYDSYPYRDRGSRYDRDRGYGRRDRRHRGHPASGCPLQH